MDRAPRTSTRATFSLLGLSLAVFAVLAPATARAQLGENQFRIQNDVFVLEGNARYREIRGNNIGVSRECEDDTDPCNRQNLVSDVAGEIGDGFDTFIVFTAFDDRANDDGGLNFELIHNTIRGIGLESMDNDRREQYRLEPNARLSAIIYVNPWRYLGIPFDQNSQLGEAQLAPMLEEKFLKDLARTIGRRWLFRAFFQEGEGLSGALRAGPGINDFYWSNFSDSGGSIMGGTDFLEVGDGRFEVVGRGERFVPLDRYLMGMLSPTAASRTEVYWISGATIDGGEVPRAGQDPFNDQWRLDLGDVVSGDKVVVTMDQIIAGMGERDPSATSDEALPFKRFVFGILSRDEFQQPNDYQNLTNLVEDLRVVFSETWQDLAGIRACTAIENLRGQCPEPQLRVENFEVTNDRGNSEIRVGDTVDLNVSVINTGSGPARNATVEFIPDGDRISVSPTMVGLPTVNEGEIQSLLDTVRLTVNATTCGSPVDLGLTIRLSEGPEVSDTLRIPIGTELLRFDPLDEAVNWRVNPDGTDGATSGTWDLAVPRVVLSLGGVRTQPGTDRTPGEESDLAFITGPRNDGLFSRSDVDGGRTTLQSPVYAIGDARAPLLRVWLWRSAYDFTVDPALVLDNPLEIQVSTDGGGEWRTIRSFTEQTEDWTRVQVDLRAVGVEPSNRTIFRFVIEETDSTQNIEAGVDDLELIDYLPGCPQIPDEPEPEPEGPDEAEGGCTSVNGSLGSTLLLLGLGLGLRAHRRRRA